MTRTCQIATPRAFILLGNVRKQLGIRDRGRAGKPPRLPRRWVRELESPGVSGVGHFPRGCLGCEERGHRRHREVHSMLHKLQSGRLQGGDPVRRRLRALPCARTGGDSRVPKAGQEPPWRAGPTADAETRKAGGWGLGTGGGLAGARPEERRPAPPAPPARRPRNRRPPGRDTHPGARRSRGPPPRRADGAGTGRPSPVRGPQRRRPSPATSWRGRGPYSDCVSCRRATSGTSGLHRPGTGERRRLRRRWRPRGPGSGNVIYERRRGCSGRDVTRSANREVLSPGTWTGLVWGAWLQVRLGVYSFFFF